MLRRSIILFDELTTGADLTDYRAGLDHGYDTDFAAEGVKFFDELLAPRASGATRSA